MGIAQWEKQKNAEGTAAIDILLDWLTIPENFEKWRGDSKDCTTKTAVGIEIANHLEQKGIPVVQAKQWKGKLIEFSIAIVKLAFGDRKLGKVYGSEVIQ